MTDFIDRWGNLHYPDESSVFRKREGVFTALIVAGKMLVTWPDCAPDVPELPGGGIDPGETKEEALIREVFEEADVPLPFVNPAKVFEQEIGLYADDCGAFWHYKQTYYLLNNDDYLPLLFEGERQPEDALKSRWVDLDELSGLQMHAVHWKVLENLL